jgi:ribonuclease-3
LTKFKQKAADCLLEQINVDFGVRIRNRNIFLEALTHQSVLNETTKYLSSYERLEFLGDAVLDLSVSTYLYKNEPKSDEGEMHIQKSIIVRKSALAKAAKQMDLGKYVISGKGVNTDNGRGKESILADVYEALCGAVYLSEGQLMADKFITNSLIKNFNTLRAAEQLKDPKSRLQELLQESSTNLPEYKLKETVNLLGERLFEATVFIESTSSGIGVGRKKSTAEQKAAEDALNNIGQNT